ncbi:MAG: hypothetical protein NTW86_02095 [Candidatus Sumerlaeota bacterium]|nr:hypothetical protein [Candidatus Sumerlaeota bacterium]
MNRINLILASLCLLGRSAVAALRALLAELPKLLRTGGFYGQPVCSPTRAGFFTGRNLERWGSLNNPQLGNQP